MVVSRWQVEGDMKVTGPTVWVLGERLALSVYIGHWDKVSLTEQEE